VKNWRKGHLHLSLLENGSRRGSMEFSFDICVPGHKKFRKRFLMLHTTMRIADKVALPLRKGFALHNTINLLTRPKARRIGSAAGHISFTVSGWPNNMQQQQLKPMN